MKCLNKVYGESAVATHDGKSQKMKKKGQFTNASNSPVVCEERERFRRDPVVERNDGKRILEAGLVAVMGGLKRPRTDPLLQLPPDLLDIAIRLL